MKIKVEQEFDCPLETLPSAREKRYNHLEKFPELKKLQIMSEERTEDRLKQVRHISIAESLPSVLATFMPAGSEVLIESSEFILKENLHTFEVIPGGNL